NCHHRPFWRWLYNLTRINPTRHGFRGWLNTEVAIPKAAIEDEDIDDFLVHTIAACEESIRTPLAERLRWTLLGKGDPNDCRRVDLPGVGSNLQDRYEVGVVNRMNFKEWWVLKGAKFSAGDPQYNEWKTKRDGVYTTNGAVAAIIKRSVKERPLPDLFIFALLGYFRGYFPNY